MRAHHARVEGVGILSVETMSSSQEKYAMEARGAMQEKRAYPAHPAMGLYRPYAETTLLKQEKSAMERQDVE